MSVKNERPVETTSCLLQTWALRISCLKSRPEKACQESLKGGCTMLVRRTPHQTSCMALQEDLIACRCDVENNYVVHNQVQHFICFLSYLGSLDLCLSRGASSFLLSHSSGTCPRSFPCTRHSRRTPCQDRQHLSCALRAEQSPKTREQGLQLANSATLGGSVSTSSHTINLCRNCNDCRLAERSERMRKRFSINWKWAKQLLEEATKAV